VSVRFTIEQIKLYLLFGLLGIHLLYSFFGVVPAPQLIDEGVYHWTIKNFARSGSFSVWTGYEEFPSIELVYHFFEIHGGHAVLSYPAFMPIIGWPFYELMGFRGLFLMNALAYIAVVAGCFFTAQRFFRELNLSLNSCLIFVLCTFSWEYSQGAWPHITALMFGIWSFYFAVCAYQAEHKRRASILCLISGLLAGIAPGLRFDAILYLGCIPLIFFFARPARWRETVSFLVGIVPGLASISYFNYVRFGVPLPLYMGASLIAGHWYKWPIGIVVTCVAAVALGWVISRQRFSATFRRIRVHLLVLSLGALAIALVAVPGLRESLVKQIWHAYEVLADIRFTSRYFYDWMMTRTVSGGMVYMGGQKKALLQSLPYLPILILPLIAIIRKRPHWPQLLILAIIPFAFMAFFARWPDTGGKCLNLRYLLPALPFTSILIAYALQELDFGIEDTSYYVIGGISAFLAFFAYYYLITEFSTLDQQEFPILIFPLLIAGFLGLLLIAQFFLDTHRRRSVLATIFVVTIFAFTWSTAVAFSYDAVLHREQRVANYDFGAALLQVVPEDSIVFVAPMSGEDAPLRLIEARKIRIAYPAQDRFKDFPKIVKFHLQAGRRVFGIFPEQLWETLGRDALSQYEIHTLFHGQGFRVAEITKTKSKNPGD
jgi:hypothetical protein